MKEEHKITSTQKLLDIISKKNPDLENKTTQIQWSQLNNKKSQKHPLIYLFIGVFTGIIATGGLFYLFKNSDLLKQEFKPAPSQQETIIQPQFNGKTLPPLNPPNVEFDSTTNTKSTKKLMTVEKVQATFPSDSKEKKYQNTDDDKIIQNNVAQWKTAWEQKNINAYKTFYSPVFHTGEFDLRTWLTNKEKIFQKPGDILITIQDLLISIKDNRAITTFVQHHNSPELTDNGIKTLIWIKENNEWKIVSEKWKPSKID